MKINLLQTDSWSKVRVDKIIRQTLCLLAIALMVQLSAWAQTTIKGKITNTQGQPLSGASVAVKGYNVGTSTDENGNFNLTVPAGSKRLVISYAGYEPLEMPVSSPSFEVSLKQASSELTDVLVVGYGTQKKRDMTGAASSIKGSAIAQVPVPSFDAALQGRAPGVQVSQQSGAPGGAVRIQVRGTSSLSSGTEPLYVIDGIPVFQDISGIGDGRTSNVLNPMVNINPNDIESIEILKDAAATAIYGSRGANGVVLVTTKNGKRGQGRTTLDVNQGVSNSIKLIDYVNGSQWLQMVDQARTNSVRYGITPGQEKFNPLTLVSNNLPIPSYVAPGPQFGPLTTWTRELAEQTNTNWVDKLIQQGSISEINLSTSNGFEKGSFFISGQARDEKGVIVNHRLKRYAVRSNVEFNPSDRLKSGARLSFSYLEFNQPQLGIGNNGGGIGRQNFGATGGWGQANTGSLPIMPIFNPDGTYFNPLRGTNVVAGADQNNFRSRQYQNRFIGNAYIQYNILPELNIRAEAGADYLNAISIYWTSDVIRYNRVGQETGRFLENYLGNIYANYDKRFNEDHQLSATFGYEVQMTKQRRQDYAFEGLVGSQQEIGEIANGANQFITAVAGIFPDRNFVSVFGRANYKFKDRYLAGVSFRRDGSTAFGPTNRFGNFPAVSAGWIISNEPFAEKSRILSGFNLLKLRASYGQTGNSNIPSFAFLSNYVNWPVYGQSPALGFSVLGNPNIGWEKNDQFDVAVEFATLRNRLRGSLGYFNRKSNDMLLNVPVAPTVGIGPGAQSVLTNIGDLNNQGIEIELGGLIVSSKKGRNGLSWNADFNISFIRNRIVDLTPQFKLLPTGNFPVAVGIQSGVGISQIGGRLGEYYLAEYAGLDDQGFETIWEIDPEILRQTGKTVKTGNRIRATQQNINNNRIVHKGKTGLPTWFGGLTNTVSYKGFELSVLFTFQGGNYIYDGIEENTSYVRTGTNVIRAKVFGNTWEPGKTNAQYPILTWNMRDFNNDPVTGNPAPQTMGSRTTRFLYKGDFARLKTLQIGYTFPSAWMKKIKMQGARIYANVQNLLTITNYPGFDPEMVILGGNQDRNLNQGFISSTPVPQVLTFNGGISITF
jgi:TonB-linked SusC/RagA family outer membrane protein